MHMKKKCIYHVRYGSVIFLMAFSIVCLYSNCLCFVFKYKKCSDSTMVNTLDGNTMVL